MPHSDLHKKITPHRYNKKNEIRLVNRCLSFNEIYDPLQNNSANADTIT
jgi:hypothetical protein